MNTKNLVPNKPLSYANVAAHLIRVELEKLHTSSNEPNKTEAECDAIFERVIEIAKLTIY